MYDLMNGAEARMNMWTSDHMAEEDTEDVQVGEAVVEMMEASDESEEEEEEGEPKTVVMSELVG